MLVFEVSFKLLDDFERLLLLRLPLHLLQSAERLLALFEALKGFDLLCSLRQRRLQSFDLLLLEKHLLVELSLLGLQLLLLLVPLLLLPFLPEQFVLLSLLFLFLLF